MSSNNGCMEKARRNAGQVGAIFYFPFVIFHFSFVIGKR
jgi:hypothetical protein